MFRWIVTVVVLFAGVTLPKTFLGQISGATNTGFLGIWRGDNGYFRKDHFFSNAVWVHDVIQIQVMEDPKGGLIMDYVYGTKGKKGYSAKRRHVVLDPATDRVFMHWGDDPDDIYSATGLAEFGAKGSGTFRVEGPLTTRPHKYFYKGVFELDGDTWNYHWDNSTDGVNYKTYGTFELHRVTS
jgi:hypothetical protein